MEDAHFIEWIELLADGRVYRKYLQPGMKAEARFQINPKTLSARAYCNMHGLWKS
jgi:superoxide reductase